MFPLLFLAGLTTPVPSLASLVAARVAETGETREEAVVAITAARVRARVAAELLATAEFG